MTTHTGYYPKFVKIQEHITRHLEMWRGKFLELAINIEQIIEFTSEDEMEDFIAD